MDLTILLQANGGSNMLLQWGPLLLIVVVFYFFFIRPQAKKQKDQNKFVKEMEKGDEVVTASGIIGKITKMEENITTLQIDSKSYMRVTKGSVSREMTESVFGKK